jgi:D-alanyl-D-alanine carboxypeptidase
MMRTAGSPEFRFGTLVDTRKAPGIQYVAVRAEGVIAAWTSGYADLRSRRMEPSTTLMAYSMSKTITAIAVMQLVEANRLQLDAPVRRYLSESPYGDGVDPEFTA